ncbi:hypothetical protein A3762_14605 [Oleiphilus sp. HI0125]|uniref:DUF3450 family protein n=1 Tax=Oleiphilus sp. HI0125 TaxID=1822266 RepID=UPI0007C3FDAB|nr:DUF3450 family protein [Oleiphilus sp. HI0125]KZZ61194.1 hypothetical protein A3762_14605 [Oleiphilus sp. HI0125]
MKVINHIRFAACGVFMAVSSGLAANTDIQSLENLSQELVEIRQQIASLHDEINFSKASYNDQLRAYSNQKADMSVKISRADLNLKDLQRELHKLKVENEEKFSTSDQLAPVVQRAVQDLNDQIAQSIPFKREERLQALTDIQYRLDANLITPNKAVNQLWAFVEDELMMGRSSGIYNETVLIGGNEQLVKVLRLGKVAAFYQGADDSYGLIKQVDGAWVQEELNGREASVNLDYLFDAFAKNIRNGMFTVPNILPSIAAQ